MSWLQRLQSELAWWKRTLFEAPLYGLLLLAIAAGLLAYQVRVPARVDVGGPHDAPYLSSFYAPEPDPIRFPEAQENYRWTRDTVGIDLLGLGQQPAEVRLRLQAYRPAGVAPAQASLWIGGNRLLETPVGPQGQVYRVLVAPQLLPAGDLHLVLRSSTFRPSGDARDLGVTVDWLEALPVGVGWVEPSWYQVGTLAGVALLSYLLLRRLGLSRAGTALAGGAAVLLLGHLLAYQRLWLTYYTTTLVVLLAVGCGVAALWGGWTAGAKRSPSPGRGAPALPAAVPAPGPGTPVARASPLPAAAILLLVALLRMGGILYPQFRSSDLLMHVHNLQYDVRPGNLFFTEKLPDINLPAPYPPGLYLAVLPATLVWNDLPRLMEAAGVVLDGLAGLLLYMLARRLSGRRDVALLALLVQQVAPVTFLLFSWGNYTNMFSRVTLLLALVLLAAGRWRRQGWRGWGLLVAAMALVLLSHFADSLLLGGLVLTTAALALARPAGRPAAFRLLAALAAAGVVVGALYYSAPPIWEALRGGLQQALAGTGRSGGFVNPLPQFLAHVQAPLALLALPGLAMLVRPARRWPMAVLGGALLVAVGFGLAQALVGFSSRYSLFILPVLALGTGIVLAGLRKKGRAGRLVVGLLLAGLVVNGVWTWCWVIGFGQR